MAKAKYVTVGRKKDPNIIPKENATFRLPKEVIDKIDELASSGQFAKKVEIAENAFKFYFEHLEKEKSNV